MHQHSNYRGPEEEEKKKGTEKILEEIIVENFPNMGKEIVNQVQEAQRVPYRYQVGSAIQNEKYKRITNVLKKMEDSKTVNIAYHTDDPNISLGLTKNEEYFKMFASDTGLFVTLVFWNQDFTENIIYEKLLSDKLSANLGYLYENIIAQMLVSTGKNGI